MKLIPQGTYYLGVVEGPEPDKIEFDLSGHMAGMVAVLAQMTSSVSDHTQYAIVSVVALSPEEEARIAHVRRRLEREEDTPEDLGSPFVTRRQLRESIEDCVHVGDRVIVMGRNIQLPGSDGRSLILFERHSVIAKVAKE